MRALGPRAAGARRTSPSRPRCGGRRSEPGRRRGRRRSASTSCGIARSRRASYGETTSGWGGRARRARAGRVDARSTRPRRSAARCARPSPRRRAAARRRSPPGPPARRAASRQPRRRGRGPMSDACVTARPAGPAAASRLPPSGASDGSQLEPGRQVPVPLAEQLHRRRHEHRADDRRVDQDGDREAEAHLLHHDHAQAREQPEDGDHDDRGARHRPGRAGDREPHRVVGRGARRRAAP